jgi:hypothetical protein
MKEPKNSIFYRLEKKKKNYFDNLLFFNNYFIEYRLKPIILLNFFISKLF